METTIQSKTKIKDLSKDEYNAKYRDYYKKYYDNKGQLVKSIRAIEKNLQLPKTDIKKMSINELKSLHNQLKIKSHKFKADKELSLLMNLKFEDI